MTLDRARQEEISAYMLGTCKSESEAAEAFDVTEDDVLEAVVEGEVDRCATCAWWFETHELHVDDSGELACDGCDDNEEDE